ncbi:hypothetical protein DFJ73DRAFT_939141, partial [Zopfochytrium polystomum]
RDAASPAHAALAAQFAPLIVYHPDEKYFASSVDYMFPHYTLINADGSAVANAPSPLTAQNLDFLNEAGTDASGTYLAVSGSPAGDPNVPSGFEYLYSDVSTGTTAPIYAFVVPKDNSVIDIFYCRWSLGKNIILLGYVGDHVGDWEHIVVRTVNGNAVSVDFSAHSSGSGLGTLSVADSRLAWSGSHPVGYTALGSHGIWPQTGSNTYKTIAGIYKLTDETGNGAQWETWNNVYAVDYLRGGGYTGAQAWLNYNGHFGNPGDTSCWFYSLVGECKFSEGPDHPNRDMTGPPAQVLAAPNAADPDHSVYAFWLSAPAQQFAAANAATYKFVGVHQHCGASSSGHETDNWGWVPVVASSDPVKYSVTTDRCKKDYSRYAAEYEVMFCADQTSNSCSFSGYRQIRQYSGSSVVQEKGIVLDDPDYWYWSY